ncbi:MAG: chromosome partitioning protein ParA [Zetaproteobacteria bacterium CG12_big_fil_rev_8_21_14_0_65_55_1124]|nr:MAG: chromosome partitioning protein ParA [Zetaproteobacteria bacterium CG08_land_8_20_14_0_20_55_17]PIW42803.1 MAG: chromosome partitioning protein ParA [Zetaproteobacteria bacterium CG12_big_fil_rev_8_21_14_0_65_55_1124]PIY51615.1 MAG: chromosome partitioning protein ParA [Zetaproteobacteria bacterium CG_4_10_14_0_8_um_filter_55_43]PIZ39788.1 MAG: chromosome partitioning protein ParA [Zetaproteobacteria bacterium CG_4_10_14_0_2_um_filter_55_20]PJB80888.1 MAG: chromosome partitioning protei
MKHDAMKRVTAVANQKGGVGKTTTSINLAASLAALDKHVLLIDVDPQGNATTGLGIDKREVNQGSYEILINSTPLEEAILPTSCEGLMLVPASMDLAGAEVELVGVAGRERVLDRALSNYTGKPFDYVFIDCPPALNLITLNAFTAADRVLVTLQAEFYAMEGLTQLMDTIRRVRGNLNPHLNMDGILLTMVDRRNNLSVQVEEEVRNYFGSQVYEASIPRNVRLSEAPSFGVPVMYHDLRSSGAQAYLQVAQEMMRRG